jgi:hypothetical protein
MKLVPKDFLKMRLLMIFRHIILILNKIDTELECIICIVFEKAKMNILLICNDKFFPINIKYDEVSMRHYKQTSKQSPQNIQD